MGEFFRILGNILSGQLGLLILLFIMIVCIITLMSITIEVTKLKGRKPIIAFFYAGVPFFLGIVIFVIGEFVLKPGMNIDMNAPLMTALVWLIGIILSIYALITIKPTKEFEKRMGAVKKVLSLKEIVIRFFLYLQLTSIVSIILVPVIWIIGASFNTKRGLGYQIWPDSVSWSNYRELLFRETASATESDIYFLLWYKNTLMIAIVTCIFSVIFITLVAYVFARFKFKGKKFGLLSILVLQMFPGFMTLIALYTLFKTFGLLEKPLALTFVYVSGAIPYNIWLVKGYLQNIPKSLDESAKMDGASNFQIFLKIIFPLSLPIITFLAITMFMSPWMDFMLPRLVLTQSKNQTLAIGLYNMIDANTSDFSLFAAASVLIALPITILYASLQRYLIEGITAGANKG